MFSALRASLCMFGLLTLAACGKGPAAEGTSSISAVYVYVAGPTPKVQRFAKELRQKYPGHFVSAPRAEYATQSQIVINAFSGTPRPMMLDTGDTGAIINAAKTAGLRAGYLISE